MERSRQRGAALRRRGVGRAPALACAPAADGAHHGDDDDAPAAEGAGVAAAGASAGGHAWPWHRGQLRRRAPESRDNYRQLAVHAPADATLFPVPVDRRES